MVVELRSMFRDFDLFVDFFSLCLTSGAESSYKWIINN